MTLDFGFISAVVKFWSSSIVPPGYSKTPVWQDTVINQEQDVRDEAREWDALFGLEIS
jgi:hypothetical protein